VTRVDAISVPVPDHLHRKRCTPRQSERGQALLLLVVLMGLATGMFVFSMASNVSSATARADRDALALAQARQALIGYAASDDNRPGSLPCPDTDNDGSAELYSGTDCPGYVSGSNVYIGRLPWRTLRLPDLRDSSGERLWYAVSRNFARNPSCLPNCPDLTSDTLGQLTVTGIAPTSNAFAIVFAPGSAQGSQSRDAASENTASNYLEGENADGNNATFATVAASATFNDRLLAITNVDFMPMVEQRVAREMIAILTQYRTATGVYPWADLSDGNSNGSGSSYYNHWRLPCGTALPTNWGSGGTPVLPLWLTNGCGSPVTGWTSVIYYAVSKNRLENGGSNCTTCTDSKITVDGNDVDLVLITPGGYTGAPARSWPSGFGNITGYFEDSSNRNNNDTFVTPSRSLYPNPTNHDRIFTLP